ncbi:NAD(P)H-dependent oxidoreductase, partial [Paenibacillus sp. TAF58]
MTKTLVINAHPKVDSTESFTLLALKNFLKTYKELNPTETIEQIDLYNEHIPMIDRTILNAREKLEKGEPINSEEQQLLDRTV